MEACLTDQIEGRCSGLECRVIDFEQHNEEHLISLEMAHSEAEIGHVEIEKRVDNLKLEVHRINRLLEHETLDSNHNKAGIFGPKELAHGGPHARSTVDGPEGHRCAHLNWDYEIGPQSHILANGTTHSRAPFRDVDSHSYGDAVRASHGRLLKLNSPVFNSDDPQLWWSRCESYFEMYGVESTLWIKVASMHLEGSTVRWFQSAECHLLNASWSTFCDQLHDRFGWDQHVALIHKLFHIRQVGSVIEYVDQFSILIDLLAVYKANASPLHYATRFVDGLRDDIKSVVMIQRPSRLNIACALALVQEEAAESGRKREYRRSEPFSHMMIQKSPLFLHAPLKLDKTLGLSLPEDKRQTEVASDVSMDDKLHALCQYHCAKGLCEKCAEKWTHDHKCVAAVQLHVIEELWELFPDDENHSTTSVDSDSVDSFEYGYICAFLYETSVSGKE
jgi:hypothetical protein